jgi:hypothetical protein
MSPIRTARNAAVGAALALVGLAPRVDAQVCHGTPAKGGVEYERGAHTVANSNGAAATIAGDRTSLNVRARVFDKSPDETHLGGDFRFAMQFHANRLAICPGLGLGYRRDVWTLPSGPWGTGSITTHGVAVRPGVAVGMAQPVYRGISLIPSLGVKYAYKLWYLSNDITPSEVTASGDTASAVEIEYGLTAQYRNVYLGWTALRDSDSNGLRPNEARFFLGLTWGVGGTATSKK